MTKEEAKNGIKVKMDELTKNLYIDGNFPSDRDIDNLAHLLYERDKESEPDVNLQSIVHGVSWGMKIMRQIVEKAANGNQPN